MYCRFGVPFSSPIPPPCQVQVLGGPSPKAVTADDEVLVVENVVVENVIVNHVYLIPQPHLSMRNPENRPIPEPSLIKLYSKGAGYGVRDYIELHVNSWIDSDNNVYRCPWNWADPPKPVSYVCWGGWISSCVLPDFRGRSSSPLLTHSQTPHPQNTLLCRIYPNKRSKDGKENRFTRPIEADYIGELLAKCVECDGCLGLAETNPIPPF